MFNRLNFEPCHEIKTWTILYYESNVITNKLLVITYIGQNILIENDYCFIKFLTR